MQHNLSRACLFAILLGLAAPMLPSIPAIAATVSTNPDLERWLKVDQNNPADLQAYLTAYPRGLFAKVARDKLQQAGGAPLPAVPAQPTAPILPQVTQPAVPSPSPAPPPARTVTPVAPPAVLPSDVSGVPVLLNTATIQVEGRRIRLYGISGVDGPYLNNMNAYIGEQGGSVRCAPHDPRTYICMLPSGIDLAEAVLANGAARVLKGAPANYRRQQTDAQHLHLGIWTHW